MSHKIGIYFHGKEAEAKAYGNQLTAPNPDGTVGDRTGANTFYRAAKLYKGEVENFDEVHVTPGVCTHIPDVAQWIKRRYEQFHRGVTLLASPEMEPGHTQTAPAAEQPAGGQAPVHSEMVSSGRDPVPVDPGREAPAPKPEPVAPPDWSPQPAASTEPAPDAEGLGPRTGEGREAGGVTDPSAGGPESGGLNPLDATMKDSAPAPHPDAGDGEGTDGGPPRVE